MSLKRALVGPFVFVTMLAGAASGCFALFSLDGYGPPGLDGGDQNALPPPEPPNNPPPEQDARPPGKLFFVTSKDFAISQTDLFGLGNAKQICKVTAKSAGFADDRVFLPWLSDDTTSPSSTFAAILDGGDAAVVAADGGDGGSTIVGDGVQIVDMAGQIVAGSYAELAVKGPRVAMDVTEKGDHLQVVIPEGGACTPPDSGVYVWSGTLPNGKKDNTPVNDETCSQWTAAAADKLARVGRPAKGAAGWTTGCEMLCSLRAHLYCFEQ